MAKIKLVAWDVYGTLIKDYTDESSDNDQNNKIELKKGALEALEEIKSRNIIQCTCSDGDLTNLKNNLKEARINWQDFFFDLYKMPFGIPKDFSGIIKDFKLYPKNVLVIGDNYDIDIRPAIKQGCKTYWVLKNNNFIDLNEIIELL